MTELSTEVITLAMGADPDGFLGVRVRDLAALWEMAGKGATFRSASTEDHERAERALNLAAAGQVDDLVEELNRRIGLRAAGLRQDLAAALVRR